MSDFKTTQVGSGAPDEHIGLVANGCSGPWEISIDETLSGTERWFAQIEGSFLWLSFEIPSPEIIPKTIQFLSRLIDVTDKQDSVLNGGYNLEISKAGGVDVTLVLDDEYKDRCFLVLGRSDSPTARFSVAGEDLKNLIAALQQVQEDILPSVSSKGKTNGMEKTSESAIESISGTGTRFS